MSRQERDPLPSAAAVIDAIKAQLDDPVVRSMLEASVLVRRVDVTLYVDRGIVGMKPPSISVN